MELHDKTLFGALRQIIGISQAQLAERLKMDRSYLSRIERGDRPVDVDLLARVAAMAGVRIVVVKPEEDGLLAELHSLKPSDLAIAIKVIRLLPRLHPLRKADLDALLDTWVRSSHFANADEGRIVKEL